MLCRMPFLAYTLKMNWYRLLLLITFLIYIDISSNAFNDSDYVELRCKLEKQADKFPDFKVWDKFIYHRTEFYTGDPDRENAAWKLLVPKSLRGMVMRNAHDTPTSAHGGVSKTVERLRRYLYWPGLFKDVSEYIGHCEVCKTTKHPTKVLRPPMGRYTPIERVFQKLYVDLIGPFPRSRNGHIGILIVLDHMSKFTFLCPLKKLQSSPIINFLKVQVFDVFGVPEYIVSDNGSQFKAKEFDAFLTKCGIKHTLTAIHSPQSNSSERVNRSINAALRAYIQKDQRDWDRHLSSINSALRNSIHQSTGYSPYFVVFGQHMVTHGDNYALLRNIDMTSEGVVEPNYRFDNILAVRDNVRTNLRKAYDRNESQYNLRSRQTKYVVGQEVLRRNFSQSNMAKSFNAKLDKTFLRARVREKLGSSYYVLEDDNGKLIGTFHAKDMQPY